MPKVTQGDTTPRFSLFCSLGTRLQLDSVEVFLTLRWKALNHRGPSPNCRQCPRIPSPGLALWWGLGEDSGALGLGHHSHPLPSTAGSPACLGSLSPPFLVSRSVEWKEEGQA